MQPDKIHKIAQLNGHGGSVYSLSQGFNDDILLSGAGDKIVAAWNLRTFQPENFSIKLDATIYSIAFIKEKQILLIGTENGSVHVIDLYEKKEIKHLKAHNKAIFSIKYSVLNNTFYAASADGSLSEYELNALKHKNTLKLCSQKVRDITLSPNHKHLAVACGDCTIRIIDTTRFIESKSFTGHEQSVNAIKYHPSGKYLLSGGKDAFLNVWDVNNNYQNKVSIPAHNFAIYSISFHPETNVFATGSRDKTIKIWNADTFELIQRIDRLTSDGHKNSVNKILWHKSSGLLISCGDDKSIMVWDSNN